MGFKGEFQFLEGDAKTVKRLGPLPVVERRSTELPGGGSISALFFNESASSLDADVVFLHGAGLNAHSFDRTVLALAKNAISLDLPGHGLSSWREDGNYSPENLAGDVFHALSSFVNGPINIVGHSLGGLTAARLLEGHPEIVESVTIIDITPGIKPAKDGGKISEFITGQKEYGSVSEIVERAIEFGIGSDREALTRGVTLNTKQREDGKFVWIHHLAHLDGLSAARKAGSYDYSSLWDPLAKAEVPINLVRGAEGMVTDDLLIEWQERLPGSQTATLEGGHNLHEHNPRELALLLSEWLF